MNAAMNFTKTRNKQQYNFAEWEDSKQTKREKKKHDRSGRDVKRNY